MSSPYRQVEEENKDFSEFMVKNQKECKHLDFRVDALVNRLENVGKFIVDIHVMCSQCGLPFLFQGLPMGVNMEGATTSVDKQQARLAIKPNLYL